jgi:molybdopterin converting factor small subunit
MVARDADTFACKERKAAILVHVALYGSLSKVWGKRYIAFGEVDLPSGATKADLLAHLKISDSERGYLFINAVLCDVPGLSAGGDQVLKEGDHIGIFSVNYMWPYQYRDGIVMSDALKAAMQKYGPMHHSYENIAEDAQDESAVQQNSKGA